MYVPNDASELNFQEYTIGDQVITEQRQIDLLNAYIDRDEYLSNKRGEVTERNRAKLPWVNP